MGQSVQAFFTLVTGFLSPTKESREISSKDHSGFGLQVGKNPMALLAG
jgi:hypothetical protein